MDCSTIVVIGAGYREREHEWRERKHINLHCAGKEADASCSDIQNN